jgi:hypothetical protein
LKEAGINSPHTGEREFVHAWSSSFAVICVGDGIANLDGGLTWGIDRSHLDGHNLLYEWIRGRGKDQNEASKGHEMTIAGQNMRVSVEINKLTEARNEKEQ